MYQNNRSQDIQVRYETKHENVKKYIDIDSTYRNRVSYPLQSNFIINFNKTGRITNLNNSSDIVSLATPFATGIIQGSPNLSTVILQTGSSLIDNFYINDYIGVNFPNTIAHQYRQVIAYTGSTLAATVSLPYTSSPSGLNYTIQQSLPSFEGYLSTGSTSSTLLLSNANTSVVNNSLIRITTGANVNQIRPIYNMLFTGNVFSVGVFPPLPNIPTPILDLYEIMPFTYDNAVPLIYSGTTNSNQPVCYRCSLVYLVIPYTTLASSYGGNITNYPYVYVGLKNIIANGDDQPIYSNNPNSKNAVFKVPIEVPQYVGVGQNQFVTLDNFGMTQTIKFKPNDSLQFFVTTPDGQYIQFAQQDTLSPLSPNPLLQISALFEIERLD